MSWRYVASATSAGYGRPAGWEAVQRKYFTYNWIRSFATWVAFGLLLAALVEVLS